MEIRYSQQPCRNLVPCIRRSRSDLASSVLITVEKSPSLTMSPRVKQYLGTLPRALEEERHFALVVGLRVSNLGSL